MRVLPESGARQNYNLGDVIPLRRNGLHIPSRGDAASGGGGGGTMAGLNIGETSSWRSRWKAIGGSWIWWQRERERERERE